MNICSHERDVVGAAVVYLTQALDTEIDGFDSHKGTTITLFWRPGGALRRRSVREKEKTARTILVLSVLSQHLRLDHSHRIVYRSHEIH